LFTAETLRTPRSKEKLKRKKVKVSIVRKTLQSLCLFGEYDIRVNRKKAKNDYEKINALTVGIDFFVWARASYYARRFISWNWLVEFKLRGLCHEYVR